MVRCSTCTNLCTANAVSLPTINGLRKYRNKAKAIAKAKKKLKELKII